MSGEYCELRYNSYTRFLINKFGCKIKKISIDGGFTCPNKDGTKGWGGCIFCNEQSYTPYCSIKGDIVQSIRNQITNNNLNPYSKLDKSL
jgi:radical SAM superfamily enzyme